MPTMVRQSNFVLFLNGFFEAATSKCSHLAKFVGQQNSHVSLFEMGALDFTVSANLFYLILLFGEMESSHFDINI